jgi:hypothetical protein
MEMISSVMISKLILIGHPGGQTKGSLDSTDFDLSRCETSTSSGRPFYPARKSS